MAAGLADAAKLELGGALEFGTFRQGTGVTGGGAGNMPSFINRRSQARPEAQGEAAQELGGRHRPLAGALELQNTDGAVPAGDRDPRR